MSQYSEHPANSSSHPRIASTDYSPLRISEDSNASEHGIVQNADPGTPRSANQYYERAVVDGGADFDLEQPFLASAESPRLRGFRSLLLKFQCIPFVERNTGLLLVAFSQLFFALMHTSVKILNGLDPPISALELVAVRMALTYTCCVGYMFWKRIEDPLLSPKGVRLLLVFRGFAGFCRVFGVYYSLQYLSLSDATVLTFLSPLSTALAGHFFLNEGFSRKEAAAGVLSLIGVVLIARPQALFGDSSDILSDNAANKTTSSQRLVAVGVALVGVVGATGVYTLLRAIGKRIHPLHSLMYFSSHCVLASILGILMTKGKLVFPLRFTWIALFLLVTIFGVLAQVFLTMGLQREAAGRGTLAIYIQIIFASILEQMFFHTVPSVLSVVGTLIILGSAIFVALTKKAEQPRTLETADSGVGSTSVQTVAVELENARQDTVRLIEEDGWRRDSFEEISGRLK